MNACLCPCTLAHLSTSNTAKGTVAHAHHDIGAFTARLLARFPAFKLIVSRSGEPNFTQPTGVFHFVHEHQQSGNEGEQGCPFGSPPLVTPLLVTLRCDPSAPFAVHMGDSVPYTSRIPISMRATETARLPFQARLLSNVSSVCGNGDIGAPHAVWC